MDIQDLRYAVTTLDIGSFAQAAKRLFVSRQALSQSVKRLEDQLGMHLFTVQGNNRLVPTPEGKEALAQARSLVESFDAFLERFGAAPSDETNPETLTVAMATGAAISLPDDFLTAFRTSMPAVAQEIEETNTDGALDLLGNGRADVALVGSHPRYLEPYDHLCLVPTGLWLAVPIDNPLSLLDRIVPEDLDGQTIVTAGPLNHRHRDLVSLCEQTGIHPAIPATASNPDMLVSLAQEYRALFFTFPSSIRPADDNRAVSVLPLDTPESKQFGTYLVRRQGERPTRAARLFWDYGEQFARGGDGGQKAAT